MKKLDRLRKKGDKLEKKVQSTTGKKQDKTLKKAFKNEAKKKEQLTKLNKKYKKKAVKGLKKADGSPKKRAKLINKIDKNNNLSSFKGRAGNLKPRKSEGSEEKADKRMDKGFTKAAKIQLKLEKVDKKTKSPAKMKDMKKAGKRKDRYTTDSGTKVKVKIKRYKTKSGKKQATVKVKTKTASGQKKKKVMSTGDRKFRDDGSIRMNNPQGYSSRKKAKKASPVQMTGKAYDNKEAYNKNLSASARLHYLENERADDKSPMNMYGKKSPLEKELVGKQNNLPAELKAKIEASPAKMYGKKDSPMNMSRDLSYGGPVIDQEPKALSHMGASKVLKHMRGGSHSPLNMNGKPKEKAMKSDTVRGFSNYNTGDYVSEDDFEAKFKNKGNNPKNYPQLSVQDYSRVKEDKKGKYVVKRND
jgi:hypothetical protein